MSIIKKLYKSGKLTLTESFATETHYEVLMGSVAYHVSDDTSDMDVHAITTPPIEYVFPHTTGAIPGFGQAPKVFDSFQQHNIIVNEKNYDVAIYSLIKAFKLAAENNPNILDMLWVPDNCILHSDGIGAYIRRNRKHFLHKGSYHKFRGYSYAQMKKLKESPRVELVAKYGFDTKNAYHLIRLLYQCQQILEEGDMDITRNSEMLKSIRRGDMTLDEVIALFNKKEAELDVLYVKSTLQYSPDMKFLTEVLMACLEMKYGNLSEIYKQTDNMAFRKLEEIRRIVNE
jgi:uncharacterized protein